MSNAVDAQIAAAAPDRSSWVAANAGSGKTRVLTDRVARLLLAGTPPEKILCLTYTKAAAAEMQNRLFRTLGEWSMLDDPALKKALLSLDGSLKRVDSEYLAKSRTLFARALETPGGLKIQTIHAFCEVLLRRFPLEAGVAPRFNVLDDRQARELRQAVLDDLAERDPEIVALMAGYLSDDDPDSFLSEIGKNRSAFAAPPDTNRLAMRLGIDADMSVDTLFARTVLPEDISLIRELIPLLAASGKRDQSAAETLQTALGVAPGAALQLLEKVLLTGAGAAKSGPYTAKTGTFPTKAVSSKHPGLVAALEPLMVRVEGARQQRLGINAFARSVALNTFARSWIKALDARKTSLGLLDFDDMIDRARGLLSDQATAAWVLWRLDGGLDHILVDEAQDTSPVQWQVVKAVSSEFFAGSGARNIDRTVFVVGDEKQSIYSFQGADPAAFGGMRGYFDEMLSEMEKELQQCDLIHSFRSSPPVLALVDKVFSGPAGEGLENSVSHRAFKENMPGRVDIWPFIPKPETPDEEPWYAEVDPSAPDDPVQVLATGIAAQIGDWLKTRRLLPGEGPPRPIRAGDVMILVQRRNALFHAIIRALKKEGVPVAGADVLRIGAEMAVKDLLAVLRVAATSSDDLSLAAVLRSPLGGMSETDLFNIAHGRENFLIGELRKQTGPEWKPVQDLVKDLRGLADYRRPYELFQRILIRHDGRRKLIARLGREAEDGIDALLDQALNYERTEPPSLSGFLNWIDADKIQIKRRVAEGSDQVRVMTVHGAKGLEAPIVFLPDTGDRRKSSNAPGILLADEDLPLWNMKKDSSPELLLNAEAARQALAHAENMRLLYVAMTRAETWLVICGAGTEPKPVGDSWYSLVMNSAKNLPHEVTTTPGGDAISLSHNWSEATGPDPGEPKTAPSFPEIASGPPEIPVPAAPPLSPSQLGGAHFVPGTGDSDTGDDALARGDAIHRLLEHLPPHDPSEWAGVSERLLPDCGPGMPELLAEASDLIRSPALSEVFSPDSLAEIDVSASLPDLKDIRIQGRIDRLVIGPDYVMAVDFKSNRVVPDSPEQVPEGYLRQMGAYHAALTEIWPNLRVETAIVWTKPGQIMRLPQKIVTEALARALRLDPSDPHS